MPLPLAAVIGAAGAVAGSGLNAISTGSQNRKSREFTREMYDRQYKDAVDFWNLQNAYNSPQSQMKRFQEAGLNPNSIFGQGNPGNAGSIPVPDVQRPEFRVPEIGNAISGGTDYLSQYVDYEIKQAQKDKLLADTTVAFEEAQLKAAQRYNVQGSTERTIFDLEFDKELREVSADYKREVLRKIKAETDVLLNRDEREAIMNSRNVQESIERVLLMREQRANTTVERQRIREAIRNVRADTGLKNLDLQLWEQGINRSDPPYLRFIALHIESILDGVSKLDLSKLNPFGSFRKK